MKNLLLITLGLLFSINALGQRNIVYQPDNPAAGQAYATVGSPDWYVNLEKYWFYRYRLVKDFTKIGYNAGESLVASRRDRGDNIYHFPAFENYYPTPHITDPNLKNVLNFGSDNTIDMGHYLGMLATEYKQLLDNGMSTSRTLYEIG